MSHARNTQGLAKAADKRRQDTLKRANAAIRKLSHQGNTINFNTVAAEAGVSKAWLYREPAISQRIRRLRESNRPTPAATLSDSQRASEDSKVAIITTLKTRIRTLEDENRSLKKQLEVVYGQLHVLGADKS